MKIPHTELDKDALRGVIEAFIAREGTDYGVEHTMDQKVASVVRQLEAGKATIVFDPETETINILTGEALEDAEVRTSREHVETGDMGGVPKHTNTRTSGERLETRGKGEAVGEHSQAREGVGEHSQVLPDDETTIEYD